MRPNACCGAVRRSRLAARWQLRARGRLARPARGPLTPQRRRAQRSGTTKPVLGADDPTQRAPGKGFHMKYDFRETVAFPVTLYKARGLAPRRGCAFEQH